jgi:hypothetical protein
MNGVPFYPKIFYPKTGVLSNWLDRLMLMPPGADSLPVAARWTLNPNQMCFHVERTRSAQGGPAVIKLALARTAPAGWPTRLTHAVDVD